MKTFTREEWAQVRAKGHTRFVLLYGLLRSGVPFALFMAASTFIWSLFDHSAMVIRESGEHVRDLRAHVWLSDGRDAVASLRARLP
jgi:hypothetical protein